MRGHAACGRSSGFAGILAVACQKHSARPSFQETAHNSFEKGYLGGFFIPWFKDFTVVNE